MSNTLRKSDWEFKTSSSLGASVEVGIGVGGGGGTITLIEPRSSAKIVFKYAQLGIGAGAGGKIGTSVSSEDFGSAGSMYMTSAFKGIELYPGDLEGVIINAEISGGAVYGASVSGLWLGIRKRDFLKFLAWGGSLEPKAALLMGGENMSTIGVGAMGYVGYLWESDVLAEAAKIDLKTIEEALSTKWQRTANVEAPPIILSGDFLFNFDKYDVKPTAIMALRAAGQKIQLSYPGRHIQIQGFADSTGGNSRHNQQLSENRAAAVKNWLISNGFVSGSNISSEGYGIEYAIASNRTSVGRAKNRRVEIHILSSRPWGS